MLLGKYAGKTLREVFSQHFKPGTYSNKTLFIKNFLKMMKLMKPLFIGLVEMNNDTDTDNTLSNNDPSTYSSTVYAYVDGTS